VVADANPSYMSEDGVLFNKDQTTLVEYPCGKTGSYTIPDGVTSIGEEAFKNRSGLTGELTIPASVISIGRSTFASCYYLSSIVVIEANPSYMSEAGVLFDKTKTTLIQCPCGKTGSYTIPDGVTSIGDYAFISCDRLIGELTIPVGVTSIGDNAFFNCYGLTGVTISNGVTSIGDFAFSRCYGLTAISVADANSSYMSEDGVLFNKDQTTLIQYPGGKTGSYTIPYSITSFGSSAFYFCINLTGHLTIPSGVTSIGRPAFNYCSGLTGVTIPAGVTSIGDSAFSYCSGLTGIYFLGDAPAIGTFVFSYVNNATIYHLPEAEGWPTISDLWAGLPTALWQEEDGLLIVGPSLISQNTTKLYACYVGLAGRSSSNVTDNAIWSLLGDAFGVILNGNELTVPAIVSDETITIQAVYGSLTNTHSVFLVAPTDFTFTENPDYTITITGYTGEGGDITIPAIINGLPVITIGDRAFYENKIITGVTIPASVTSIGSYAFHYCSGLTGELTIPNGVTSIGNAAFQLCSGLTGELTIPAGVTSIGSVAFNICRGLTGVTIPASVTSIGRNAFWQCAELIAISVGDANPFYMSADGVLFNKDQTTLIRCPGGKVGSYTIPASVTTIGDYAFCNCSGLTGELTISSSVTSIGSSAFRYCTSLTAITVADANWFYMSADGVLFNIDQTMLIQCPSGKTGSYAIPQSVATIGDYAFYRCSGLTGDLRIPVGVTSIGISAFYYCSGLTGELTIPAGVTSIGDYTFYRCSGLTGVTIPESVTSIGSRAFYYCTGLTGELTIPAGVTSIGDSAFYNCSGLTGVYFQGDAPSIGTAVFNNVNNATVYHLSEATGWPAVPDLWADRPTALWQEGVTIDGPFIVKANSTNEYSCEIRYADASTSNVTDTAVWSLLGDAQGTTLVGNELSVPAVVPTETITIQAVYGWFSNTYDVVSLEDVALYVAPGGDDQNDGSSWTMAKATLQSAVDAQIYEGATVYVSNGVYVLTSEIVVDKDIVIQSLNGPESVIVDGGRSTRCFNLGSSSCVISGFTITNGYAAMDGGGISCGNTTPVITNCVIVGNTAGDEGGGVNRGTLYDCTVSQNIAFNHGGGLNNGIAYDCTFSLNTASNNGGGAEWSDLFGCLVDGNMAGGFGGGLKQGTAVDCVISNNSSATAGGGIYSVIVSNSEICFNSATNGGGGMFYGEAYSCDLFGNSATMGGGARAADLTDCNIYENHSFLAGGGGVALNCMSCNVYSNTADSHSGGLWGSTAYYSKIYGNTSKTGGGGSHGGHFYNCKIYGNRTEKWGGGIKSGSANNCFIYDNFAQLGGGGADWSHLTNCVVLGNNAVSDGGGVLNSEAVNCTITGNHSEEGAGGLSVNYTNWVSQNCIVYGNSTDGLGPVEVYVDGTLPLPAIYSSCSPDLDHGVDGNITNAPLLASLTHLSSDSPCIGAGIYTNASGTDIDGQAWLNPPSMGCDEYHGSGSVTGAVEVAIESSSYALIGSPLELVADIQGAVFMHTWNFGDGTVATNNPLPNHAWAIPGLYDVVLSAFSDTYPEGLSATQTIHVVDLEEVVAWAGTGHYYQAISVPGGISWTDAQADAAARGGYLATITSDAENEFVFALVDGVSYWHQLPDPNNHGPWLGGFRYEVDGDFFWVTGEEFSYTAWFAGEPTGGYWLGQPENYLQYSSAKNTRAPTWNDMINDAPAEYAIYGYVVEYQIHAAATGDLSVAIGGAESVVAGSPLDLTGMLDGVAAMLVWDFDDGTSATNTQFVSHEWSVSGDYEVVLTAHNTTHPLGVSATQTIHVLTSEESAIHVSPTGDDANDGSSWATAKATIQAGVDAQQYENGLVLVSNGTYAVTNEIAVGKTVTIHGVNGPEAAIVDGGGVCRGFNLGLSDCILSGFTITNGYAAADGGGISCDDTTPVITNCIIVGCTAGDEGGGVNRGTLYNCTLSGNLAFTHGGGLNNGIAYDCTFSSNTASNNGGGAEWSDLMDCLVENNTTGNLGGGLKSGTAVGCTISNNYAAINGGGGYACIATNCVFISNVADDSGGGMMHGEAVDCQISGNTAMYGGGARGTDMHNCDVFNNYADVDGGGVFGVAASLYHCNVYSNTAVEKGGGTRFPIVYDSFIYGNITYGSGGGAFGGELYNCDIYGNEADVDGGGINRVVANNCIISGNKANNGGGMQNGTANNCTISGNSAMVNGGGIYGGAAYNTIIWGNQAAGSDMDDLYAAAVTNCCSPDVEHGVDGSITNAPMLVSASHISSISPCIGSGSELYAAGTDVDGQPWLNPPSMGCDEYYGAGSVTGALEVAIGGSTNVLVGYPAELVADIRGALYRSEWNFGDGTMQTNNPLPSHVWNVSGSYDVVLTAFSDSYPGGVFATQTIHVLSLNETAVYVSPSGNDANGGASWATAKATIQAGVDTQQYAGGLVLVGGGTYALTNEVLVNLDIRVQGVDGTDSTIVDGGGSNRCFNLSVPGCAISGFTITNGYSAADGGGIYCSSVDMLVYDCIVVENVAGARGGGIMNGTVSNCVVRANTAGTWGGGMHNSVAHNCSIIGNKAIDGGGVGGVSALYNCRVAYNEALVNGGGVVNGVLYNCTVMGNRAANGGGLCATGSAGITFYNCIVSGNRADSGVLNVGIGRSYYEWAGYSSCSPDLKHGMDGNITNAPLLLSSSQLSSNSLCIGAGVYTNTFGVDIEGEPWLNPPAMGCEEFQGTGSLTGSLEVAILGDVNVITDYPMMVMADIKGAVQKIEWSFGDGGAETNNPVPVHGWAVPGDYEVVLSAFNNTYPAGVFATQTIHVVSGEDAVVYVSPSGDDSNNGSSWITSKATIQAGVDAQQVENGRVVVGYGTYSLTNEIVVHARAMQIEGMWGAESTIVDGGGSNRCFNLAGTIGLKGFTVQNGYIPTALGGGAYCYSQDATLEDCVIRNNSAKAGGGVFRGTLHGCTVSNNVATANGGGQDDGSAYDSFFFENQAKAGGGLDLVFNNLGVTAGEAYNCILQGNTALNEGGGIIGGIAHNCLILDNHSDNVGGGCCGTRAINCTVAGNSADVAGGGSYKPELYAAVADLNSIVISNSAPQYPNFYTITSATNCCAPVAFGSIAGWIADDPLFVDAANGNYRLRPNSPCINWGLNTGVTLTNDLDGNTRVVEGHVDIGCYEYQGIIGNSDSDGDGILDEWEHRWFGGNVLPDGNADGDVQSNGDEYISGTDPTNSASYFHVTTETGNPSQHMVINWESITGRVYNVYWTPSLMEEFQPLGIGIQYPQNSYTDTVHSAESSGYYRVVVMRADYDADGDGLPNDWESQYAVADAFADGDHDGFNNMAEFIAGTIPTNGASYFTAANSVADVNGTNCFVVEWISIPDRLYSVQWTTNLMAEFQVLETGLEHPQNSYTDTVHGAGNTGFYKINVELK